MMLTVEEQNRAAALVEELKWLQSRCMGGENPDGVVMIAKSLSGIRGLLAAGRQIDIARQGRLAEPHAKDVRGAKTS